MFLWKLSCLFCVLRYSRGWRSGQANYQKYVLRNPDEHTCYFVCDWTSLPIESSLFEFRKLVLRNLDEHIRCFSTWKRCFCELCIDGIIAHLIGKVGSAKSRRVQSLFFKIRESRLWILHRQNHRFSNWKYRFCEIRTKASVVFQIRKVASVNSVSTESLLFWMESRSCKIQKSTIVVFVMENLLLLISYQQNRCLSHWKISFANYRRGQSLLLWLEALFLWIPNRRSHFF